MRTLSPARLALVSLAFSLPFAQAASAERVTKYPIGSAYPAPMEIVTGSDGALWFPDRYVGSLVRMSVDGGVRRYDLPTSTPGPEDLPGTPSGR